MRRLHNAMLVFFLLVLRGLGSAQESPIKPILKTAHNHPMQLSLTKILYGP
jgi:hypothetical protein